MSQICSIAGCGRNVLASGFCNRHYLRWIRHGHPLRRTKAGNGEGTITNGYREIRVNSKRIYEHRFIMESYLGRKLSTNEVVHHIDGDKLNNAIENLCIRPRKLHVADHPQSLSNLRLGPNARWGTKS